MAQLNKLNLFNDGLENKLDDIIKLLKKVLSDKGDDNHHKCGCDKKHHHDCGCDKKHHHGKKHDDKCEDCCIVTLVIDQVGGPTSDVVVTSYQASCNVNCLIVEGTTPAADAIACLCEQGFNIVEAAQVNPNRPVLILRRCRS